MTGLYNGGRPGPRSGPSSSFIEHYGYIRAFPVEALHASIYRWSTIVGVYKNSKTVEEAYQVLDLLGIDKDALDEYRAEARRAYQMLHHERHSAF